MLSHAASAALFLSRVGLTRSRVVQTAEERITRTTMPPGRLERLEVGGKRYCRRYCTSEPVSLSFAENVCLRLPDYMYEKQLLATYLDL